MKPARDTVWLFDLDNTLHDAGAHIFGALNRSMSADWPNITRKGEAPADADQFRDEKDKYSKYFSANPGKR